MSSFAKSALIFLVCSGLMTGATTASASAWHHFDIVNKSSHYIYLVNWSFKCVEAHDVVNTVAPGQTVTYNWEDSNDIYQKCTNRDKLLAFSIQMDGYPNAWNGILGMTHRKLSGSTWYNGQFYAESATIVDGNTITGTDGNPPPGWIQALCSHDNQCFGPFSQMEIDGKNGYNWQRFYVTDGGWAFQISDPY